MIQCPKCHAFLSMDFVRCPNCHKDLAAVGQRQRAIARLWERGGLPLNILAVLLGLVLFLGVVVWLGQLILTMWRTHGLVTTLLLVLLAIGAMFVDQRMFSERLGSAESIRAKIEVGACCPLEAQDRAPKEANDKSAKWWLDQQ